MIDYCIVGCGLAGIAFAETALQNGKSIRVFDNSSQNSSTIAGGLYNPVILKRFSEVWNAQEQLSYLKEYNGKIEAKLNIKFNFNVPIYRKLFSVNEQNDWFVATDKINLSPFLSSSLIKKKYNGIDSPFGFGEVLQTGYVDTVVLLKEYHNYLKTLNLFSKDTFNYNLLDVNNKYIQYNDLQFKNIVFAEGFGLSKNPFFNQLPLDGTKGELLIIKAPNLNLDVVLKSSVFILPLGNDLFKVGATYNWLDKTNTPTQEGKKELEESLKNLLQCSYQIVEHLAGVRPTVKDRKPMVGSHPKHNNLHILNGLGTRGVMLAPKMALDLYNNIENNIPLDINIDIKRFKKINWI